MARTIGVTVLLCAALCVSTVVASTAALRGDGNDNLPPTKRDGPASHVRPKVSPDNDVGPAPNPTTTAPQQTPTQTPTPSAPESSRDGGNGPDTTIEERAPYGQRNPVGVGAGGAAANDNKASKKRGGGGDGKKKTGKKGGGGGKKKGKNEPVPSTQRSASGAPHKDRRTAPAVTVDDRSKNGKTSPPKQRGRGPKPINTGKTKGKGKGKGKGAGKSPKKGERKPKPSKKGGVRRGGTGNRPRARKQ